MKIKEIQTRIIKWSQTSDNYVGRILESDNPKIGIASISNIKILKIKNNLYITNEDTDFILDIDIESLVMFDNENKAITTADLYELYEAIKESEDKEISKTDNPGVIWTILNVNKKPFKRSFGQIESQLKEVLIDNDVQLN